MLTKNKLMKAMIMGVVIPAIIFFILTVTQIVVLAVDPTGEDVREALKAFGYPGIIKSTVEGHGKQKGLQQQFRRTTFEMDFLPKLKIEIVVLDEDMPTIINVIINAARTGEIGDGKIFVLPVDNAVRIRTGEDGDNAI